MTTCPCVECGGNTDAFLCRRCADKLERVLAEIPSLLADLDATIARQANTVHGGGKPTKKFGQPLPVDLDAATVRDEIGNELATWVRHLCDQRGVAAPSVRAAGAATWLVGHVESIRLDEAAQDAYRAILTIPRRIYRVVDTHAKRWAGPCTQRVAVATLTGDDRSLTLTDPTERECGWDLRARPGTKVIVCEMCGAEYDTVTRQKWIVFEAREHMAGAQFIADALTDCGYPVKAATVRQWAKRDLLFAYQDDEQGRPLYRIGDVLDLVRSARERADATRWSA